MLWYWITRRPGILVRAEVIGDGTAKWRIVMSPWWVSGTPKGITSEVRLSSIDKANKLDVNPLFCSRVLTSLALSPIASPWCAAGTHWLITMLVEGTWFERDRWSSSKSIVWTVCEYFIRLWLLRSPQIMHLIAAGVSCHHLNLVLSEELGRPPDGKAAIRLMPAILQIDSKTLVK